MIAQIHWLTIEDVKNSPSSVVAKGHLTTTSLQSGLGSPGVDPLVESMNTAAVLNDAGIPTTLRDTRGKEIDGACGQLAAEGDEEADGSVTPPDAGRSGASASIDLSG